MIRLMRTTYLFLLLAFAALKLNAQSEYEVNYFKEPTVDTFTNQSVVVTKMFEEYTYTNAGGPDYKVNVVIRMHYKLKDLIALESFGKMEKNQDLKRFVLQQVKPNGKVNTIYEYYDKNYPDDGYDNDEEEDEKKKEPENIPIENLEIGDIIDYKIEYTYTTKTKNMRKVIMDNASFDDKAVRIPNTEIYKDLTYKSTFLQKSYPISSGLIIYNVPSELEMVQKSFNCSFKFDVKTTGGKSVYQCRIKDVDAYRRESLTFPYLYFPVLKYTLIQTDANKAMYYPYQFGTSKVSNEDIVALGRKLYADKQYISKFTYYVDTRKYSQGYTQQDLDKFFSSFLSTFKQSPNKKHKDDKIDKLNKLHDFLTNNDDLNSFEFSDMAYAVILARFCDKLGIKYKMMATLPAYEGKWEDVISPYEITWGIYITGARKDDIYITDYTKQGNIYTLSGDLANTDIILFDAKKPLPPEIVKYPEPGYDRNMMIVNSDVMLSDDHQYDYHFTNEYTFKGHQKYVINDYISHQFRTERLRTNAPYYAFVNFWEVYNMSDYSGYGGGEKFSTEQYRLDSSYNLYINDYYKMGMYQYLYDEYDFRNMEIDSFRVYDDGSFPDDEASNYGFKLEFKAGNVLLKTISDSVKILNLGMFISSQYDLSNYKVYDRKTNVHVSDLRELQWNSSIELPAGYKCVNLSDFNCNFENEAGIFKAEVQEVDGKLQLKITKIYKTHFLPREKWAQMVEFLQMADSYYNKKLLLEKR